MKQTNKQTNINKHKTNIKQTNIHRMHKQTNIKQTNINTGTGLNCSDCIKNPQCSMCKDDLGIYEICRKTPTENERNEFDRGCRMQCKNKHTNKHRQT